MLQWLQGLGTHKLRTKQLEETVERLLAQPAPSAGENEFCLSEKTLKRLCGAAKEVLLKDASLVEIKTEAQVVVVGDLHGQYQDVQAIFQRLGQPGSDAKIWVFLGDYVDRGPMGLEIVATLLALKLRHPSQVYLLRGNHECSEITVLFGFCGECQRRSTLAVWETIMQVFDALPLAALLNDKVFLCHGGISPSLKQPQDINSIQRPLDVDPNSEGVLCDLLWADPSANISGWCPNPRGVSFLFGLDVAQQWMRDNGLRAIVRAHMVQQTRFEVLGNNEVMTVFSAADYRESGNTGAVLVVAASLEFEFVTFVPSRPQPSYSDTLDVQEDKCSSILPPLPPGAVLPDGLGVYLPGPAPRPSPFAAEAEVAPGTEGGEAGAAEEAQAASQGSQAMQEEVTEEHAVIEQVKTDPVLLNLVRRSPEGLNKLGRVPAETLARTSSGAA